MECGRCVLLVALCLVLSCGIPAEARSLGRSGPGRRDSSLNAIQAKKVLAQQGISPSLEPESSKKFFKKDYPNDHRPGVDVLHFKHPYPVVQDSGEFDSDFVKDENSDNGNWKAQQEYDRLRHKLQEEKREAAKALDKKREEEQELKDAMERYEQEAKENQEAKKKVETAKKHAAEADTKEVEKKTDAGSKSEGWSWDWWPFSWPTWKSPEPVAKEVAEEGSGVGSATKQTEKAMSDLEDCQKELAEARDKLKKMMDELEQAKATETEADAAAAAAAQKQLEAEKLANGLHDKSSSEEAEHAAAKAAYLKQQEIVDKLKADIDISAAKVKAYRDAEDRGGGVYNTPAKSFAISRMTPQALVLLLAADISWRFA